MLQPQSIIILNMRVKVKRKRFYKTPGAYMYHEISKQYLFTYYCLNKRHREDIATLKQYMKNLQWPYPQYATAFLYPSLLIGAYSIELILKACLHSRKDGEIKRDGDIVFGHNLPQMAQELEVALDKKLLLRKDLELLKKLREFIEFKAKYPERKPGDRIKIGDRRVSSGSKYEKEIENLWIKFYDVFISTVRILPLTGQECVEEMKQEV